MKINETKFGFKLLSIEDVKDYNSTLYQFEHIKSGGKVIYLANDDTNCGCAFGFRTLPQDSTGVCHIIEHSLLCGSQKFPLKEPFVNLLKGSLATFLNAFTAYDWTMYPFTSQTPKDFDNILEIYADAVFNPLSMIDEKPFLQEGWHLELLNEEDTPSYKGVVYNEMKGAMSDVTEILTQDTLEVMYKDSFYRNNSGGDPDVIPTLTYEAYKAFYKKHYTPQNAMTFFYGKMDIESKLEFLDKEYFSKYEKSNEKISIVAQTPHIDLNSTRYYPIGKEEKEKNNTYISLCYGLAHYSNVKDNLAMNILTDALLSSNDSILKKALLDAKLGENVITNYDDDNIIPALHIYLQKTNPNKKDEFRNVFENEVKRLVKEGIDKELLLASINHYEFNQKELDFGRMPKGIVFAMSLMSSFNYEDDYIKHLNITSLLKEFKEDLKGRYFEDILEKYIINSKHKVEVTLIPDKTLLERKEKEMAKKMLEIKKTLTTVEKKALVKQTKELLAYQNKEDSKKELATLPKLSIKDIPTTINYLASKKANVGGMEGFKHVVDTNGIGYLRMYFNINKLKEEDTPYLLLLERLLLNVDTKKFTSIKLKNFIKTYLGNFYVFNSLTSINKNEIIPYFVLSASSLDENINYLPEVINEVLLHSKFSKKEVLVNIKQIKNSLKEEIISGGMKLAITLARAKSSKSSAYASKAMSGPIVYNFYKDLEENFDYATIKAKLNEICKSLFSKKNVKISMSGNENTISLLKENVKKIKLYRKENENQLEIKLLDKEDYALIIPNGVSYNAIACNLEDISEKFDGRYAVLSHIAIYDYLWKEIRVKGGAYGTTLLASPDNDFALGTYRDPNVANSYEVFNNIVDYLTNFNPTNDEFKTYIIGTMANFDNPVSTPTLINNWDINYLSNKTKEDKIKVKKEALSTKKSDIVAFKDVLAKVIKQSCKCSIGNEVKIKEYNKFDKIESL